MWLIWLFYNKFDTMLSNEERERRDFAEHTVFKWNIGLKSLSAVMLALTIMRGRPYTTKTNILVDVIYLYATTYCFLLSYVVGVYKAWPHYENITQKMMKSQKRVNVEKDGTLLEDSKIRFYGYDTAIAKYL